jgi:hypothetical protein
MGDRAVARGHDVDYLAHRSGFLGVDHDKDNRDDLVRVTASWSAQAAS